MIKINILLNARKILSLYKDMQFSPSLAYQITKFLAQSNAEEEFYYAQLQALINEYAEKNEEGQIVTIEGGQGIKIKPDLLDIFQMAYEELENTEVEAPTIKLALSTIIKELPAITVNQMSILMNFVDEEK